MSCVGGFRLLKDPPFFADSLFLKRPARIMTLMMIMVLALLVYSLAECKLRLALQQNAETIPDQKGRPTQNPTLRWVFQTFEGWTFKRRRVGWGLTQSLLSTLASR